MSTATVQILKSKQSFHKQAQSLSHASHDQAIPRLPCPTGIADTCYLLRIERRCLIVRGAVQGSEGAELVTRDLVAAERSDDLDISP